MDKLTKYSQIPMMTCSLCNKTSEDKGNCFIYFGEWMVKKEVTVHYYCLVGNLDFTL